jgi:stage V sporulation protein K
MTTNFKGYGKNNSSDENSGQDSIDEKNEKLLINHFEKDGKLDYALYPTHFEIEEKDNNKDDQYDNLELEEKEKKEEKKTQTTDEVLSELNSLIGLERVKIEIQRLLSFARIQNLRKEKGLTDSKLALHSVFYGNPGTGKTTVARLYGRLLKASGLLSKGHLVETDRAGLVASYVGQTSQKTDEKIKEALGGILFIDEAYSLAKGDDSKWDYGSETIEILLKRMEDYRDDFVVIAAGYPDPMIEFLNSNEGIKSRFSTFLKFNDYSPEQLLEIFKLFCSTNNYFVDSESLDLVDASIKNRYSNRDKYFGNARFVRNLFEMIIRNQAHRIDSTKKTLSSDDLCKITPEDVPFIIEDGIDHLNY